MRVDFNLLRKYADVFRISQKNRFKGETIVDKVFEITEQLEQELYFSENLDKIKNVCIRLINKKVENNQEIGDCNAIPDHLLKSLVNLKESDLSEFSIVQMKNLVIIIDAAIISSRQCATELDKHKQKMLSEIGNNLHKDVIISDNEDNNGLVRFHGENTSKKHINVDLIEMVDGVNLKMGRIVAGSRGYYLLNDLVELEYALQFFATGLLIRKRYNGVSPPTIMNKDSMEQIAQLTQFDEELYKVANKISDDDNVEGEVRYLIATAEQPIAVLNADRWIPKSELPIRYYGVSECYRQEVGSHGRDTRGIFRVHQFKKIEQFCITSPYDGESECMFAEMISNAENFYQQLGIPYRVVNIVSGALNNAAAIKYDLEGWFPGSGKYRELVSCSNCTDYQSRSVLTRFGENDTTNEDTEYVHMLNCTMSATTRTLCAILENYQTDEGIIIPEVLRPCLPGGYRDFIPFVLKEEKKNDKKNPKISFDSSKLVMDINILRKNPDLVRKSHQNRLKDVSLIDKVLEIDNEWKQERFTSDNLNKVKNMCSKLIGKKMKNKEQSGDSEVVQDHLLKSLVNLNQTDLSELSIGQLKNLILIVDVAIKSSQLNLVEFNEHKQSMLSEIGNILLEGVIISDNRENNGLIRVFADTTTRKRYSLVDLVKMVGGANFEAGRKVYGDRGYYLQNVLVELEFAIIMFGLGLMIRKGYAGVSPPTFMNKETMQQIEHDTQLDKEFFKLVCKISEEDNVEGEEIKYLTSSPEQPLAFLNADRWIPKTELPIRYYGISQYYRQEVGSQNGILNVNESKKIDQFCITSPFDNESERMFSEMLSNAENFYQQLGIPYRVVNVVSGELNNAAALRYDLEAWFPGSGEFHQLVSCSNYTDYLSRSVLTRYGETKPMNQETEYVHMLSCTLSATNRTLCAILENYQTDEGIVIPEVLQPFMQGEYKNFIPFAALLEKN